MAYNGSIELISGITQANGGTFPLVDAPAVRVTDDKRLDEVLTFDDVPTDGSDNLVNSNGIYDAVGSVVEVSEEEPEEETNKLWIVEEAETEVSVATEEDVESLIMVSDTEPTEPYNKLWIYEDGDTVSVPTTADLAVQYVVTDLDWSDHSFELNTANVTCYKSVNTYTCKLTVQIKKGVAHCLLEDTEYDFPVTAAFKPKFDAYYTGSDLFKGVACWDTNNVIKLTPSQLLRGTADDPLIFNVMFMFVGVDNT